jgi:zinc protease
MLRPFVFAALLSSAIPAHAKGLIGNLPPIETFQLANGLSVAVVHDDSVANVAIQVWYHAGSKDEPRDRRGTAHMFEHMMFDGSQHVRAGKHATSIAALGGYTSAVTDEDATHFVDVVPASYVDYALTLEAERMRNLMFRKVVIDADREGVKDELARAEASPVTRGFLRFLASAFTKHPYAWTAGGNAAELDKLTADTLEKYYAAYYQPNNAMVVLVGHITAADAKASVEKSFGAIAKAPDPARPSKEAVEPPQTAAKKETGDAGPIGLVIEGFHIPAAKDKDIYAIQLATQLLGSGEASRLKQRLEHDKDAKTKAPLAQQVGMEALVREDPGLVVVLGVFRDPKNADAIQAAIADEIAKLAKGPPSGEELRRAKTTVQTQFVFAIENVNGLAEAIGRSWILTGDPQMFRGDLDEIEKVTAADVQRVTKTYFAPEKATVLVVPVKQ